MRDRRRRILGDPLVRAGRAFGQLPLVAKQVFEEVVAPLGGRGGPGDFQAAGDGVAAKAAAVLADPAQALVRDVAGLGLLAHQRGVARAVRLAKGVATGDQRHSLLIVHGHAGEGVADVARRGNGIGVAVRALGVHVDQAHLHGGQGLGQVALPAVALVAAEPGGLGAPVHVFIGFPHIGAAAGEAEGLETHRFQSDIPRQDHQIGPRDLAAVLLLDGPQEATGLVEVGVVRPAVERRKALLPCAGAAAAVGQAVGARAVPCHAHEQRSVVAKVSRPPILRVGHEGAQVGFQRREIQALEFLGVVEAVAHGIDQWRALVERAQVELVGPPVGVATALGRGGLGVVKGAFGVCGHGVLLVWVQALGEANGRNPSMTRKLNRLNLINSQYLSNHSDP